MRRLAGQRLAQHHEVVIVAEQVGEAVRVLRLAGARGTGHRAQQPLLVPEILDALSPLVPERRRNDDHGRGETPCARRDRSARSPSSSARQPSSVSSQSSIRARTAASSAAARTVRSELPSCSRCASRRRSNGARTASNVCSGSCPTYRSERSSSVASSASASRAADSVARRLPQRVVLPTPPAVADRSASEPEQRSAPS